MWEDGLWEVAHAVIEGVGGDIVAAKAVGAADDDLELVVEALDGAGGDGGVGPKPVEDEVLLLLEGAGDLGEGLDARGLGGAAPVEQESLARPQAAAVDAFPQAAKEAAGVGAEVAGQVAALLDDQCREAEHTDHSSVALEVG